MADSSLNREILRNLIEDQKLPPEDFIIKKNNYETLNFMVHLFEENNTHNKYIITVLSQILKKTEEEISNIATYPPKKMLRLSSFMKFDKNYDYRNNFKKRSRQDLQWIRGGLAEKVKGMELFDLGSYIKFRSFDT